MGIMANKFTRCAYQQLVICLTPTEHLFVPDGPLASCMCVCVCARATVTELKTVIYVQKPYWSACFKLSA